MLKEETLGAPATAEASEVDEPDQDSEITSRTRKAPANMTGLYRAAWRWHFYSGMFVIPILLLLAVTGLIYLFKPQVEPMLYRDKMRVPLAAEGSTPVPLEEQVAAVKAAYPGYSVVSVQTPTYPGRSTQINVSKGEEGLDQWTGVHKFVFVNPNTGEVLGDLNAADTFMANVRELHGNLMMGGQDGFGDKVVEIIASWGMILVATWSASICGGGGESRERRSVRQDHSKGARSCATGTRWLVRWRVDSWCSSSSQDCHGPASGAAR